ncbi:MAG: hypothetical protein L0387_17320 [Acidobacteria bacterium]|nr:hypothetical protein [Acidobacteriota bacterium]MCI0623392.1 hypothetical protein [Acidobacteriota bacterium]MCI0724202.1 hypothetical protein [Acidobacteriota bacterium]
MNTYGTDSPQVKDCSDRYHFEPQVADKSRPLETLDWNILEGWLDKKLSRGQHPYVLRHELASVLFESGV